MNKNAFCYFVLLSEGPDAMPPVAVVCSLIFLVEWLGLIKSDLCIESKIKRTAIDVLLAILEVSTSETVYEMDNRLVFQANIKVFVCTCYGKGLVSSYTRNMKIG